MTIPAIFRWPSPWLWGAIGVLILADSHDFWDWIQISCLVLFASVVYYVRNRTGLGRGTDTLSATPRALDQRLDERKSEQSMSAGEGGDIPARLDEVEARLRDVLDVMIAVSEKMDRWEREGVPAADPHRAVSS